jgi:ribosomal protein L32
MKISNKKKNKRKQEWKETGLYDFVCPNCKEITRYGHRSVDGWTCEKSRPTSCDDECEAECRCETNS